MEIKIYEKPVITKFVKLDEEEFELRHLYSSIEQIMETRENDTYGDYSFRKYELYHLDVVDKLVKMGLVKNYTGSRMADLYCMKDENGLKKLLDTLYELDE